MIQLGCFSHHTVRVDPVEVAPIHVTMDVHLHVDGELDARLEAFKETEASEEGPEGAASEPQHGLKPLPRPRP